MTEAIILMEIWLVKDGKDNPVCSNMTDEALQTGLKSRAISLLNQEIALMIFFSENYCTTIFSLRCETPSSTTRK